MLCLGTTEQLHLWCGTWRKKVKRQEMGFGGRCILQQINGSSKMNDCTFIWQIYIPYLVFTNTNNMNKYEKRDLLWKSNNLRLHHNEFQREAKCRERQKLKISKEFRIIKSSKFQWLAMSCFTSLWGHSPWEHAHHELADPCNWICLLCAGAQRTQVNLSRKSV